MMISCFVGMDVPMMDDCGWLERLELYLANHRSSCHYNHQYGYTNENASEKCRAFANDLTVIRVLQREVSGGSP